MDDLEFRSFMYYLMNLSSLQKFALFKMEIFPFHRRQSEVNTFCITPVVYSAMGIRLYHASNKLPTQSHDRNTV